VKRDTDHLTVKFATDIADTVDAMLHQQAVFGLP
jgi:hypothetical protein